MCKLIPKSKIFTLDGKLIQNGMFGVSKDEFEHGWEVFRLIMNLVPVNKLCRNLKGDVSTLPSWSSMTPMFLDSDEVLVMSSEDIRCFFYLFEVPESWERFLSFGREVPSALLPLGVDEPHFLTSRVLPMGFLNSVTVAQHVHRRIARLALHSVKPTIGPQSELRRDQPYPNVKWAYRVYLDNFDILERQDPKLANLVKGEPSPEVLSLRQGYEHWGLPRHPKKAVQQQTHAEIQGAFVDGVLGRVKPKPQKVLKYIQLAWALIQSGQATQKQLQIVCGGFVYCCMFRRALLGLLNRVWTFIISFAGEPPVVRKPLPLLVQLEIMRFIAALPLAQMDFRTPMLGSVTASDASEYGGGFCVSNGLTPVGVHAASCPVRGDLPEAEDHVQVLTIGLFDGIGALRVAADALQLPMAGHVSSEVSKEGNRVLDSHFPDSIQVGNVVEVSEEDVKAWATRYCNVGVVLVGGGPPCQGVSGLNADRKGALRDQRSNLFIHVRRIYELCVKIFRWAQVHYLMESVFSMDEKDRGTMSEHMQSLPWMLDASDIAVCRRPRLYWISWELLPTPDVLVEPPTSDSWKDYGVVRIQTSVKVEDFVTSGWEFPSAGKLPTFTTARPRDAPGNRPAGLWQCQPWEVDRWKQDKHRYPPYVYRDQHCFTNTAGEHRLPTIAEKEVAMGFPLHYTAPCLPKGQQHGQAYSDVRHTLIGNSWHVPTIAWLLKNLFHPLGMTPFHSTEQVLRACSPGGSVTLQSYLQRLPLRTQRRTVPQLPEDILTKKLMNFVSVKGEDLLLQATTENVVKFHRLRTSVPAKLWRWRTVSGWPWRYPDFHINVLEMEAVLTCLKWRIHRKRQFSSRFLHLTDSLVTLHALTRGRSSSRKLRAVLSKINALILASNTHPLWGYVSTHQNPADRPSRRPIKRTCQKRKRW